MEMNQGREDLYSEKQKKEHVQWIVEKVSIHDFSNKGFREAHCDQRNKKINDADRCASSQAQAQSARFKRKSSEQDLRKFFSKHISKVEAIF